MDNDLFQDGGNQQTIEPPKVDENKNYIEELVGEDKKFKSVDDLAKGKVESDMFIDRLKGELQGLRDELKTRVSLQEFMDQMNEEKNKPAPQSTSTQDTQTGEHVQTKDKSFSPEDIEKILEDKLNRRDLERTVEANLDTVKTRLQEHFGENYVAELKKKAQEIGIGENFLNDVAKSQPKAFFKLVGIDGEVKKQENLFSDNNPKESVNTMSMHKPTTNARNKQFYDNIRKKDPAEYWSVKVQNQMHKDALSLGEEFFN